MAKTAMTEGSFPELPRLMLSEKVIQKMRVKRREVITLFPKESERRFGLNNADKGIREKIAQMRDKETCCHKSTWYSLVLIPVAEILAINFLSLKKFSVVKSASNSLKSSGLSLSCMVRVLKTSFSGKSLMRRLLKVIPFSSLQVLPEKIAL